MFCKFCGNKMLDILDFAINVEKITLNIQSKIIMKVNLMKRALLNLRVIKKKRRKKEDV